jgi:hypothetical protein
MPLGDDIVVVSGLPRSGTSLLMQMLQAGGIPILTDGVRAADEDNPRGYLEYEPVKATLRDSSWISAARGKAVKVVVPLVCHLPAGFAYRFILVERDYNRVLDSQARMLAHRGEALADGPERRERLRGEYAGWIADARRKLKPLLVLSYEEVLRDPAGCASAIAFFVEAPHPERMAGAVKSAG